MISMTHVPFYFKNNYYLSHGSYGFVEIPEKIRKGRVNYFF